MMSPDPVTVFYSYAHEDEALLEDLRGHLKLLERRQVLAPWHDRRILAGQDWAGEIDANLRTAELVLLLVSADFIESDYIFGQELALTMQRHAQGLTTVVPIVVRSVNIEEEDTDLLWFMKLQGLPTDLRPVTSWPNADEAWTNVAKGLRATVKAIQARRPAGSATVPPAMLPPTVVPPAGPASMTPSMPPSMRPSMPPIVEPIAPSPDAPIGLPQVPDLHVGAVAPPAPDPASDAVLDGVLAGVGDRLAQAAQARGEAAPSPAQVQQAALPLIDVPDFKRVLWVDDRPDNNRHEIAVLAKLQIEVVTALSTAEAAARISAPDGEGFDLVISDWERPAEGPEAGLQLAERLRVLKPGLPLIYYHARTGARRPDLARRALAAGAFGEAVLPAELMALVGRAFRG